MLFNFRLEHFKGWSSIFEISIINSSMLSSIGYFIFDYYILFIIIIIYIIYYYILEVIHQWHPHPLSNGLIIHFSYV